MSATNRGSIRRADDAYFTPAWCVHRLLDRIGHQLPRGHWLEPCAGDGAIIRAVNDYQHRNDSSARPERHARSRCMRCGIDWIANDIRDTRTACLEAGAKSAFHDDLLVTGREWEEPYDLVISNPPYSHAQEVVSECLKASRLVIMLLRLNFLGSSKRAVWLQNNPPDVYVLPNRPCFTNDGRTDACEYAWFVWRTEPGRTRGSVEVLDLTPKSERQSQVLSSGSNNRESVGSASP